jgi:hypothetical protein
MMGSIVSTAMAELLFSAVTSAFLIVRLLRGPWRKNPQYLACAICGSVVAALLLHAFWPSMDGSFIVGGIAGLAGSWGMMALFDAVLGVA